MRAVFSRLAECDLEEIGDYIAADNLRRAVTFVRELRAHCARIADAPLAWPARPQLGPGIRSSLHGRYVVFFRASAEQILIVRILHGARDLPAQLEGIRD
ncbi:type II toxin-antitoxin system RelE/ParE family toxin [Dokdonella soli]|uniref:Type II toxin-antitoxin system RelE/ParE family toxin n=1 Tax=Dokdonella soli TaxID=529810 RepID=A0ABN1IVR8_9GAMM